MKAKWLVRGDIDGFFGLFVDNLLQLMLIKILCQIHCGLPADFINGRILPAAAISILLGNLFYAWQARQLMKKTGRTDITALPYGINTPSLIAYIFLIMAPIYNETKDYNLAWQAGLFACLLSGVMETIGAFVGDWLRRNTPRAALLTALAGIAITFISMNFVFRIFAYPAIAILPMLLILLTYAGRIRLPFGVPGGFVAVLVGVGLAWLFRALGYPYFEPPPETYAFGVHPPVPVPGDLLALLKSETGWKYLAIIFPMGLFNVIGSLQNLESAEAAGDRYETRPSLLANGIGTLVAGFFGSPFPTTIYIGHPAWKAMGARAAYSTLNGIVIALLCLIGGVTLVLQVVPLEATLGILLWIGIIMSAQAFQAVPKSHCLAVALGLIPALAAWALDILIKPCLILGGKTIEDAIPFLAKNFDLHLNGMIALSQGFMLSAMVLAAMTVFIVERQFLRAAGWALAAAALSMVGLIHAFELTPAGIQNKFGAAAAPMFGLMYFLAAVLLLVLHLVKPGDAGAEEAETKGDSDVGSEDALGNQGGEARPQQA